MTYTDNMPQPKKIEEFPTSLEFKYKNRRRTIVDPVLRETSEGNLQIAGVQVKKGGRTVLPEVRVFRVDRIQGEIKHGED